MRMTMTKSTMWFHCVIIRLRTLICLQDVTYWNHNNSQQSMKSFFLYALKTVGVVSQDRPTNLKHPEMSEDMMTFYLCDFRFLLSREERFPLVGLSHVLLYLAKPMLTAYHNNIKEHFVKRLLRYVNQIVPKDENITEAL